MKQLNTLTNYLLIAIAVLTVSSCSKNENNGPDDVPADPKMLSFGFYAEDNDNNVLRDYIVEQISGNTITIELPKEVDRSSLVARFTSTENAMVTVDGSPQQSGKTALDFNAPVDYIVTEGKTNARYTVNIVNASDYVWTRLGVYADFPVTGFEMRVNPATDAPYFSYVLSADETDDRKVFVARYEDNNWSTIGENLSQGRATTNLGMTFNPEGDVYISYTDYDATPSQAPVVQRYNGSSWSVLGNTPTFPAKVTYNTIGMNPANNEPVFFGYIDDRNYSLPRRSISASYYSGSAWNVDNQIAARPFTQVGGIMRSKTIDNVLYLGVYNNNVGAAHTYSVYAYSQNSWTTIIDNAIEPDATNLNFRDFDMDVAPNGDIYVIASDNAEETFRPRVKKYDAVTKTWSQVGSTINVDQATTRHFAMAVSPNGRPHVIYRNEQNYPTVVSFDEEAQNWTAPNVLANVETVNVFIEFAPNGTGYASYMNGSNNIVLHKYDVPTN